jgi:Large polyvalent protein-associated domain 7
VPVSNSLESETAKRAAEASPSLAPGGRKGKPPASPASRASAPQPENAIQATRRLRKDRREDSKLQNQTEGAAGPPPRPSAPPQGDSDPWTVPQSVRDRFVQDGHKFYFPDGVPAFKDRGRRLSTPSENTQVVHSLIEIARSRGWSEVTVSGTDRFRQEAWRQARLGGLSVRGYRPDEAERAQLIRALGRGLPRASDSTADAISETAAPTEPTSASRPAKPRGPESVERIKGRLLEHGRDAYRHDPEQQLSYFVRLQTPDGTREVWGKDIERAVTRSLTQPKIGQEVVLQRTGRDAVTVQRHEQDESGKTTGRPLDTYRNRWALETAEFFDARALAAQTVRDPAIDPRQGVKQHPELAGTYLNLRAAELAGKSLRDGRDQRRFVSQVREALAVEIERGEPLQPVRLRERRTPSPATRPDPERSQGLAR